jgi:hypothetical protein
MSKLWILGDSYSTLYLGADTYLNKIAVDLKLLPQMPGGHGGSSLPYMFAGQWPKIKPQLQTNDMLLIAATMPQRTWLFEAWPGIGGLHMITPDAVRRAAQAEVCEGAGVLTREQMTAFNDYYVYLHRDRLHLEWLRSWFEDVNATCCQLGIKAVVLDSFNYSGSSNDSTMQIKTTHLPAIIRGNQCLQYVSTLECANHRTQDYIDHNLDPRMNHLSKLNHAILAEKITYSVKNNMPLDLTSGWASRHIDSSQFASEEYLKTVFLWESPFKLNPDHF